MVKTVEENRAFVKALKEVVYQYGDDWVHNQTCVYFARNRPMCLIGQALFKLGYQEADIVQLDIKTFAGSPNNCGADLVLKTLGYDDLICLAARKAQIIQDGTFKSFKGTWGEALEEFLYVLNDAGKLDLYASGTTLGDHSQGDVDHHNG